MFSRLILIGALLSIAAFAQDSTAPAKAPAVAPDPPAAKSYLVEPGTRTFRSA